MRARLATLRALSNTLRSGEYSGADVMNAALFLIDFSNMLQHALHLSSGGHGPDEKIYTKRDVEFLVTVTRGMEASKAGTQHAGENRTDMSGEMEAL